MRIAIVGGCASGKSTIAAELKRHGHDAYIVGQEHSGVKSLWSARSPEALIYLHVTLEAVKQRRGDHWPAWLYNKQQERLMDASDSADIRVNTAEQTEEETVNTILDRLSSLQTRQLPDG